MAETDLPDIKTDLHIIDRLTEKEEEVYRTLGDAGSAMKLYDAAKETAKVEKALAGAGEQILFQDTAGQDEFDFLSLYGDESDRTAAVIDEAPLEQTLSFYSGDPAYYEALLWLLLHENSLGADEVLFGVDGLIEVKNTAGLRRLLYDMPPESKPRTWARPFCPIFSW